MSQNHRCAPHEAIAYACSSQNGANGPSERDDRMRISDALQSIDAKIQGL